MILSVRQTHARVFQNCKLKYKLMAIDKLVPRERHPALSIGTACHAGRAEWLRAWNVISTMKDKQQQALAISFAAKAAIDKAVDILKKEVIAFPSLEQGALEATRIVVETVGDYCITFNNRFPGTAINVIAIEIPFEVEIATYEDLKLYVVGTQDADIIYANQYRMNFEYKTTKKQLTTFFDKEYMSRQHKTYSLAQSIIIGTTPYGTLLDATRKPLKTIGPQHDSILIPVTPEILAETRHYYTELLKEIAYAFDNDYFPANRDSCYSIYGKCEYLPICRSEFDPHVIRNMYMVVDDNIKVVEDADREDD